MAYITTKETAAIRAALKAEFGNQFKFSVARRSGGIAVAVAIVAGDTDFSTLWSNRAEGDYGYGSADINVYHLGNYGKHTALFEKIAKIIKTAPANAEGGRAWFDKSDSMTDYFHTAFYFDLKVGKWDKPYINRSA